MQIAEKLALSMKHFYDCNPFVRELGIELVKIEVGSVKLKMVIDAEYHVNAYNIAHGGALMTLADTAMGASCLSVAKKVVTLDFNMNCIKAAEAGKAIVAVGKIIHNGKKTIVAECEIIDDKAVLYAKARGTFYVVDKFAE